MPGDLKGDELGRFVRDAASSHWHQRCTAKMGQDAMAVLDSQLKVYGIEHLHIADASIMPRVTTGNTMAPVSSPVNVPQKSSMPSTDSDDQALDSLTRSMSQCRQCPCGLAPGVTAPHHLSPQVRRILATLVADTPASSICWMPRARCASVRSRQFGFDRT
jgi:hypothetical protein